MSFGDTSDAFEMILLSVSEYISFEPFTESICNADAYAVQAAGHFVAVTVELTAGVQGCQHDLQGAFFCLFVHFDRYASSVIFYGAASVGLDAHVNLIAKTCQRLVDGVIQHFIDQMVQSAASTVADVHIRPFAHRFYAPQDFYITCVVCVVFHCSYWLYRLK